MIHGRVECPKCGDRKTNCVCSDHRAFVTYVECANCTLKAPSSASHLKQQILNIIDLDLDLLRTQTSFEALLLLKLKRIGDLVK
jgi:transcription elongation factor Elf1